MNHLQVYASQMCSLFFHGSENLAGYTFAGKSKEQIVWTGFAPYFWHNYWNQ